MSEPEQTTINIPPAGSFPEKTLKARLLFLTAKIDPIRSSLNDRVFFQFRTIGFTLHVLYLDKLIYLHYEEIDRYDHKQLLD